MLVFRSLLYFFLFLWSLQGTAASRARHVAISHATSLFSAQREAFRRSPLYRKAQSLTFGCQEAKNRELFHAARRGDLKEIQRKLEEGAELNGTLKRGRLALKGRDAFLIELEQACQDHTAVQAALESGKLEAAYFLLRLGGEAAGGCDQELIASTAGLSKYATELVFQWTRTKDPSAIRGLLLPPPPKKEGCSSASEDQEQLE